MINDGNMKNSVADNDSLMHALLPKKFPLILLMAGTADSGYCLFYRRFHLFTF